MSAPSKAIRLQSPDYQVGRRWWVLALAIAGAGLFLASWLLPYWQFKLFAPQYPQGLELIIHLDGVRGDTQEINIINHYIGMAHLDEAAQFEREWSLWLVGALGMLVVVAMMAAGKNLGWIPMLIGIGLPLGFVVDTFYYMYSFGHNLDPRAPIDMKPFTPTLFGEGRVGQFKTMAGPSWGWWMAAVAVVLLGVAFWQRRKVCQVCPAAESCGVACPHGLVLAPKQ